jgi:hypothetical protein
MLASHGGLTPPAPGGSAVRTFADETATCAINERSFTESGGSGIERAQLAQRLSRRPGIGNSERFLPNEDARMPRGAYAPRSWWFCGADICRRNCDLCDTLVYRRQHSFALQRATRALARRGSITALATAIGFRGVITFITHDRMVRHGWLTPAAPGARRRSTEI